MYSANFDYYRPGSLDEAIQLLKQNEGARILAGGHSLLPAMKFRLAMPAALVDIGRIPGLAGIERSDGMLRIGAMTTHQAIADSEMVQSDCPLLSQAAAVIGDQQVRNRGTIGGSLAYADPAADYPTVIKCLGGMISTAGGSGSRQIAINDWFAGLLTTTLQQDEVVTSVSIRVRGPHTGAAYMKHRHPASSYAVVGVAAQVVLKDGRCEDVRLAVGGATANPVRCTQAENSLKGKTPNDRAIHSAAGLVAEAINDPLGDVYASAAYRLHLATVLARRALEQAIGNAGG